MFYIVYKWTRGFESESAASMRTGCGSRSALKSRKSINRAETRHEGQEIEISRERRRRRRSQKRTVYAAAAKTAGLQQQSIGKRPRALARLSLCPLPPSSAQAYSTRKCWSAMASKQAECTTTSI